MKHIYNFIISKKIDGVPFAAECCAIGNSLRMAMKEPFKGLIYETHKWHYAGSVSKKDVHNFAYDELVATKCDFCCIYSNLGQYTEVMRIYRNYSRKLKCRKHNMELLLNETVNSDKSDKQLLDFAISVLERDSDDYYRRLCNTHDLAAIAPTLVKWHLKWIKRNPAKAKQLFINQ